MANVDIDHFLSHTTLFVLVQVKLLCEETEVSHQTLIQNTEDLKASRLFCEQLQTQLMRTEQHMENVTAVKDCRCVCVCLRVCVFLCVSVSTVFFLFQDKRSGG